jgi:hypothetical protein
MCVAMLVIRDAQMNVFRDKILEEFEGRRLVDLAHRFPSRYKELGQQGARAIIQRAVRMCDKLGVHAERDVANVIDLMVYYGESFDVDPKLEFETAPLRNSSLSGDARVPLTMARLGVEPGFHE